MAAGLALLLTPPQGARFQNFLLALLVAAFFFGLRELGYKEFRFVGQMLFGRDFQQNLQEKLNLGQLRVNLAATQSPEEWWNVLRKAAMEFGWLRLYWMGPQGIQETVIKPGEPSWTFLIPLGHMGSLQIDGGDSHSANLSDLAAVIK